MSDRTQLLDQLMALPDDEREDIALRLLESLGDGSTKEERSTAWREEIARRLDELKTGSVSTIDWQDSLAGARKMLEQGLDP